LQWRRGGEGFRGAKIGVEVEQLLILIFCLSENCGKNLFFCRKNFVKNANFWANPHFGKIYGKKIKNFSIHNSFRRKFATFCPACCFNLRSTPLSGVLFATLENAELMSND